MTRHTETFRSGESGLDAALRTLKLSGCSVLVTGVVPDEVVEPVVRNLLGSEPNERIRVLGLLDRHLDVALDRLDAVPASRTRPVLVNASTGGRSTTTTAGDTLVDFRPVAHDLNTFELELDTAIQQLTERHADGDGRFAPGELRVSVDSLRPVLSGTDGTDTAGFVRRVSDRVRNAGGMVHFTATGGSESVPIDPLRNVVDIVVEHRVRSAGPEQRWVIPERGIETEWISLK